MEQMNVATRGPEAPGPRPWPLLGNVGIARGVLPYLEAQWRKHGDLFQVTLGSRRILIAANPEQIHQVLIARRQNYLKGSAYDGLRALSGENLVTLEGDAWKERRSLAQPAFHRQALEKLSLRMVEAGDRYFTGLELRLDAKGGALILQEEMVRLTLDVVIESLFGRGTLESSQVSLSALSDALELLGIEANGVPLPDWLPTPHKYKMRRTLRRLDESVHQIIRSTRERVDESTLLAMLMSARDEHGQPLSDKALRDELIILVIAGHETTALTLTWLFALLADRPEIRANMRAEVDEVLGGDEPTFASVAKLPYLRQVVEETLRLRPPGSLIGRNAAAADVLGGFHVPSGQTVLPFIWAAHRHPDHWSDPLRFMPERFEPSATKSRHPASYLPFSIGPRTCIGNSFALLEASILLSQLVRRFEISVESCDDVRPLLLGSLRPSRPIRVKLTPRRRG